MSDHSVIAVFGISGVGKTTLIKRFLEAHSQFSHLQAGTLIKRALQNIPRDQLRITTPEQIIENQYSLVEEFWKDIEAHQRSSIIFDGHSIIYNDQRVIEIPVEIINALKPQKIIFVEDDPERILKRRNSDTSRKRNQNLSFIDIQRHQEIARNQAQLYASEIGIKFYVIKSGELEHLKASININ